MFNDDSLLNRREFLFSATAFSAGALILPRMAFAESPPGILISPSMQLARDGKSTVFSTLNLSSGKLTEFAIPLETGHSWIPQTGSTRYGAVPESGGRSFCLIDLKAGKSIRSGKTSSDDLILGGHGEFSADGKILYLTQSSLNEGGAGSITIREVSTFKELGRVPTHGQFPHEMYLRAGGKQALVANLGYEPDNAAMPDAVSFVLVNLEDGKKIEKSFMRGDPGMLKENSEGLPSELRTEASYFLQVGDKVLEGPRRGTVILHPHSNSLSVWNLVGGRRLVKYVSFSPRQPIAFTPMPARGGIIAVLSDQTLVTMRGPSWVPQPLFPGKKLKSTTHLFSGGLPA